MNHTCATTHRGLQVRNLSVKVRQVMADYTPLHIPAACTAAQPGARHVDCPTRTEPPLYVRRPGIADPDRRSAVHPAHTDRYLPQYQHSGSQRRLDLQRPVVGRHGTPDHLDLRTSAHLRRRRYRTYRIELAEWRG